MMGAVNVPPESSITAMVPGGTPSARNSMTCSIFEIRATGPVTEVALRITLSPTPTWRLPSATPPSLKPAAAARAGCATSKSDQGGPAGQPDEALQGAGHQGELSHEESGGEAVTLLVVANVRVRGGLAH
jgi:hypothetical protein